MTEPAPRAPLPPPPAFHGQLTTVGVTGTNGKTTTTAYVAAALGRLSAPVPRVTTVGFFVGEEEVERPGCFDTFVHTLRTGFERGARHAAIELSSEALARGFIHTWPCKVGVFTNLTRDHQDAHGSAEHYLASKAQLFVHLPAGGAAVLNGRDPASALLREVIPPGVRILHYGVPSRGDAVAPLDLSATDVELTWEGNRVRLAAVDGLHVPGEVVIRAIGDVFAENALAALLAAIAVGVPAREAADAIAAAPPPPGRFEVVTRRPYAVLDYAHTPDALERTVATARALCRGRLTVVFGAGGNRDREKRPLMGRAARRADRIFLTSDNPRREDPGQIAAAIQGGLEGHGDVRLVLDRAEAIRLAMAEAGPEDVVLVAGKGHELVQQVGSVLRPFSDREVLLGRSPDREGG